MKWDYLDMEEEGLNFNDLGPFWSGLRGDLEKGLGNVKPIGVTKLFRFKELTEAGSQMHELISYRP